MSSEVEGETGIHFWDKGWQLVRLVKNWPSTVVFCREAERKRQPEHIWIYRKRTVSTVNSFKRTNLCKHYRPWFMIYQDLEETEYEYKRAAKKQPRTMKKTMHLYSSLRYAWCYLTDTAISCLNLIDMSSSNRFLWLSVKILWSSPAASGRWHHMQNGLSNGCVHRNIKWNHHKHHKQTMQTTKCK